MAVHETLSREFREYLVSREQWFLYLEDYRHALAHRIRLIPLSQVLPYLGLAGDAERGWARVFREVLIGLPPCRSLSSAPRLAPDCRHAFARIVAADDVPVARRVMVRGEPEDGFERDVPVEETNSLR